MIALINNIVEGVGPWQRYVLSECSSLKIFYNFVHHNKGSVSDGIVDRHNVFG